MGKLTKKFLAVLMVIVCLTASAMPAMAATSALIERACYTDYYGGKMALYVYTGSPHEKPNYQNTAVSCWDSIHNSWLTVPVYGGPDRPLDYGINMEHEQNYSNGWWVYYIGGGWYPTYLPYGSVNWNNDNYWMVYENI
jgi:hypothetical protein